MSSMVNNNKFGPTISICWGMLVGGILGVPFLRKENPIGFLSVTLGSLLGGLIYRYLAKDMPLDPTARKRRYLDAIIVAVLIHILTAMFTGLDNGEKIWIIQTVLLGVSVAVGILVSGDRRPPER